MYVLQLTHHRLNPRHLPPQYQLADRINLPRRSDDRRAHVALITAPYVTGGVARHLRQYLPHLTATAPRTNEQRAVCRVRLRINDQPETLRVAPERTQRDARAA